MLLLRNSINDRFIPQIAALLNNDRQVSLIQKAVECVMTSDGESVVSQLYESLLVINLYNASSSISNARSVTSSYRMTNKPSEIEDVG